MGIVIRLYQFFNNNDLLVKFMLVLHIIEFIRNNIPDREPRTIVSIFSSFFMQEAIRPKILECERVASSKQSVHEDKSRTSYSGVNVLTTTSKQSGMVDVPSDLKKLPPSTKVNDAAEP